jgi:hypothetical protein
MYEVEYRVGLYLVAHGLVLYITCYMRITRKIIPYYSPA